MNIRQLAAADYLQIKAAFRRLVKRCGGVEAAASCTRADPSRLSKYQNPDDPMFAPIDVVADLEAEVNEPIVSDLVNTMCSESRIASTPEDPSKHCHALTKELGDVAGRIIEAQRDGKYTLTELRQIEKELQDLIFAAQRAHGDVCQMQADIKAKSIEAA